MVRFCLKYEHCTLAMSSTDSIQTRTICGAIRLVAYSLLVPQTFEPGVGAVPYNLFLSPLIYQFYGTEANKQYPA